MNKKEKRLSESSLMPVGGFIILIGLLLLATTNQWIGLSARNSWPISLLLPGLVIFIAGLRVKNNVMRTLLLFFGIVQTLLGVFFFTFTFGVFQWSDMGSAWPIFIMIPGAAFLAVYWLSERKAERLLASGLTLSVSAAIAMLLLQLSDSLVNAKSVVPILIIAIGVGLVVMPRLRKGPARHN